MEIILDSTSRDSSISRFLRIGSVPQNMTQHLNSRFDLQSEKALVAREGAKSVCCQSTVRVQHLQFALANAAGLHETIHQFVITESQLHLQPFRPLPSPVIICALKSCPAAWHGAGPFMIENLVGLASHIS